MVLVLWKQYSMLLRRVFSRRVAFRCSSIDSEEGAGIMSDLTICLDETISESQNQNKDITEQEIIDVDAEKQSYDVVILDDTLTENFNGMLLPQDVLKKSKETLPVTATSVDNNISNSDIVISSDEEDDVEFVASKCKASINTHKLMPSINLCKPLEQLQGASTPEESRVSTKRKWFPEDGLVKRRKCEQAFFQAVNVGTQKSNETDESNNINMPTNVTAIDDTIIITDEQINANDDIVILLESGTEERQKNDFRKRAKHRDKANRKKNKKAMRALKRSEKAEKTSFQSENCISPESISARIPTTSSTSTDSSRILNVSRAQSSSNDSNRIQNVSRTQSSSNSLQPSTSNSDFLQFSKAVSSTRVAPEDHNSNPRVVWVRPPHLQLHRSSATETSSTAVPVPNNSKKNLGSNISVPDSLDQDTEKTGLRPIFIDASNVGFSHGRNMHFSYRGVEICVTYFKKRGHKVFVVLPNFRKALVEQNLLRRWETDGTLVTTPSRKIDGRLVVAEDDRYVIQCAAAMEGVIVTTDHYRDHLGKNSLWDQTINKRLLMFTFVGDILIFPDDPLGRMGPDLDDFLKFPNKPVKIQLNPVTDSKKKIEEKQAK